MQDPPIAWNRIVSRLRQSWPAWVLRFAVACLGLTLLCTPGWWGRDDWDYFAHHYEAMRKSVLEFHQIPWWNPWSCGGLPLAANPQLGLMSINFLLVLLFGTYPGLKLAMMIQLLLAAEGARWLAGIWLRDELARAMVGWMFVANGSVAMYVAAGHLGIQVIAWIPWAIGFAFFLERDARWGFTLGAVIALAALTSIHYLLTYLLLVLAVILVWRFFVCERGSRRRLVTGGLAAGSIVLALAGMRMTLAAELVLDFPRGRSEQIRPHITPEVMLTSLVRPGQDMRFHPAEWYGHRGLGWHEFGCYVGVVPLVLFFVSVRWGWRWWHSLALVCFWLSAGNSQWYHLSWWLTDLPILGTMRVATRWRVIGVLGLALSYGAALERWRNTPRGSLRLLASVLAAWTGLDLGLNALPIYRSIFIVARQEVPRDPSESGIVQLEILPISFASHVAMLAMLRSNYGVIYDYEPIIGQDEQPLSSRFWRGNPDYRGEHWSPDGPVEVLRWSPNAISLRAPPHAKVHINQNPGSYWLANGQRAFPRLRSVNRHAFFTVPVDTEGRVELTVWPRVWNLGCVAHGLGILGLALFGVLHRRGGSQRRSTA